MNRSYCYEFYPDSGTYVHVCAADNRTACGRERTPTWHAHDGGFSPEWLVDETLDVYRLGQLAERVQGQICWPCAQLLRKGT